MTKSFCVFCVLFIWTICSCGFLYPAPPTPDPSTGSGPSFVLVTANPNASPTPTPFQPAPAMDTLIPSTMLTPTETLIPTDTKPTTSLTTETFTPQPTIPPATPVPANARTQYTLYLTLDYAGHAAGVDEIIIYSNTTGQNISNIVLAVEPNLWSNCFTLNVLSQDGAAVTNYSLNRQRLTINLAQPLQPGTVTTFALNYNLTLPPKQYEGTFGYLGYQINLTDWYPFIVPYSNGWVLHDPWAFGEHLVYDAANYDVNVKVNDSRVVVAASGLAETNGDWRRYRLNAARTFVLSASTAFKVTESAVGSALIRSYYFAGDENAGQAVLRMATQSLGLYSAKFAPYSYPSLSVVETEMSDGQEYDGLVFLAEKFYAEYNGTARSNLIDIGTHEIAHQWWFGLVGSDQAVEPWLDEAMATYSEEIFYEYNYPTYGNWWWSFRVNYFSPTGYVDQSIYNFGIFRPYVNAVYLNGANFLGELRMRVGDDVFFAFLKDYAAHFSHGHAAAADFFAILREHTNTNFSDIVRRYFQGSY